MVLMLVFILLSGCATSTAIQQAHWHYLEGDTEAAVSALDSTDDISSKDQILYWLEKGMYLHYNGDYQESTAYLLKAAEQIESTDYVSLSNEAKALLANDWAGVYRGEYSEQLWIHSVLMMNFLLQQQFESAAVEARRALDVIARYPDVLEADLFTRSLIATSFEAARQTNDAYIVNTNLAPSVDQTSFDSLVESQQVKLGFVASPPLHTRNVHREAIIFISDGHIPSKSSGSLLTDHAARIAFPQYYIPARQSAAHHISVDHQLCDCLSITSDFGQLVASSLGRRGASLVAKAVVRAVAKEALAEAVEDADEIAGGIARILLFALEEADTRSWQSLPRHYSLLRVPLSDDARELRINVNGTDRVIELPSAASPQPLLFYTLHSQLTTPRRFR